MAFWLLMLVLTLPSMLTLWNDPAPGLLTTLSEARRYACERASLEEMQRRNPGLIEEMRPRGDWIERQAVLCEEPVMGAGARHPRDVAVLATLSEITADLATRIAAMGAKERTWLVEVHYPSTAVGSKIRFATKTALVEKDVPVSDRVPTLAFGDIQVLSSTNAIAAHAIACNRYFAKDRLSEDDAVLSLLVLDRRETALHAGICIDGRWQWLQ